MWCEHCQTDVAAEFAVDGHSLLCGSCRQPLREKIVPSLHQETQSAREFLQRWARERERLAAQDATAPESESVLQDENVLDGLVAETPSSVELVEREFWESLASPLAESADSELPLSKIPAAIGDALPAIEDAAQAAPVIAAAMIDEKPEIETDAGPAPPPPVARKSKFRIDAEHSSPGGSRPHTGSSRRGRDADQKRELVSVGGGELPPPAASAAYAPDPEPKRRKTRIDAEHAAASPPHFDVRIAHPPAPQKVPGRNEAMWGQLLAYLGVGALSGGAVLVLWGYFGGIESYASTGWLITTAGQMVLLLGIVTLIGGGMQQTTHEVSQRIDHLGGRMIRIEESTQKILRGPHYGRSGKRSKRKSKSTGDDAAA